jgi:hypothetical protein
MFTDLDNLKALMTSGADPATIQKMLVATDNFIGINLESVAKLMLPLYAGLRNRLPVDKPKQGGAAALWRTQIGYGGFNFAGSMGTAFHTIGNPAVGAALTATAPYKTQAVSGEVEYEAIPMAQGFDDPLAVETSRVLSILLKLEELIVLGGNVDALTAPAPAGVPSTLVGGAAFAAGVWTFRVAALTLQGTLANTPLVATNLAVPAIFQYSGESIQSAGIPVVVPMGGVQFLDLSWPAVPGALGYKIYCEDAAASGNFYYCPVASLRYRKITAGATDLTAVGDPITTSGGQYVTVNHVQLIAPPVIDAAHKAPTVDGSAGATMFDGLVGWMQKQTICGITMPSPHIGLDMDGAPLTTVGSGVSEFDQILEPLWKQWVINPTLIITDPAGAASLTDKLIAANGAAMYRLEISQERGSFTGGVFVGGYLNKFAASMMGYQPATIPVWAHPYMEPGTFLFLSERIPYQYSKEARGFALDVLTPYTYFELARTQRSFPFSTFFNETLKCYHPMAQASIKGARVE